MYYYSLGCASSARKRYLAPGDSAHIGWLPSERQWTRLTQQKFSEGFMHISNTDRDYDEPGPIVLAIVFGYCSNRLNQAGPDKGCWVYFKQSSFPTLMSELGSLGVKVH